MDTEYWLQVESLLGLALTLEGSGRSAFLSRIANSRLRAEVESLLNAGIYSNCIESVIGTAAGTLTASPPAAGFPSRFQIQRQVGQGGMGTVFEAIDRERNLRVALKSLTTLSPMHLYSFKQEFRSIAGIVHPNLVTLYDLLREGDQYYLSMEFVDGLAFLDYVWEKANPDRLRDVLRQIVAGLSAIHAAGKLHRDLKPSNLIVCRNGRAVILDFGLVTEIERERFGVRTEIVRGGTPAYMSPEHVAGVLTPASDWYSLGVILFQALTRSLPFEGAHCEMRAALGAPAPSAFLGSSCPADLDLLCRLLLLNDPTARPSGLEVLRILGDTGPVILQRKQTALFVDRKDQLRQLEHAFSALCARQTTVVLVSGAAGSGKTALLDRFLETISLRTGVLVLTGRCHEQDAMPFKGVDSLIDQLSQFLRASPVRSEGIIPRDAACLASVFPVLDCVLPFAEAKRRNAMVTDRVELRRRAFLAMQELLGRIGDRWRLVIWLDDLHWLDQESADLLSEVLRSPNSPVLLLLFTYRGEAHAPLHSLIEALEREPVAKANAKLDPLCAADAVLLAGSMLDGTGRNSEERAIAVARDSGGVPFFIRELAREAISHSGAKPTLESLIWGRVTELDQEPRRLMYLIAIAGRPLSQRVVFAAAGIGSRSPAILNVLTNAGLLCTGGPGPSDLGEPYHDRIRETITARMDGSEKRVLHRRLAEALERVQNSDPELLAAHFEACGELRRAGAYYERAADRAAAAVAFNRAAELYRRTLLLREFSPEERAEVELRLAEVLANSGRSADAGHHYLSAAQGLVPDRRLRVEGLAAYHLCVGGHLDEGQELVDQLLRRLGRRPLRPGFETIAAILWCDLRWRLRGFNQPARRSGGVDPVLLAQIDLLWFAAAGIGTSDLLGGFYLLLVSVELSQKAREPTRMIRAYAWYATMQLGRRSTDKHLDQMLERCRAWCESIGDPPASRATLALTSAIRKYFLGMWSQALAACIEAERVLVEECRGLNWELAFARALKLTLLMNQGEVSRLQDHAPQMLEDALNRGDLATAITISSFAYPYSQIASGNPGIARDTARYWLERWPGRFNSNQEPYAVHRGLVVSV